MSGHNKWSKIKRKKEATDAKKSKVFSKFAKLIAVESKKAGGDINSPALKGSIEQAKAANMPLHNIERAVKKGASGDEADMQTATYEAYGPGGSALVIECLTDNTNRTAAEIKHLLSKNNLSLAGVGSVLWAFEKKDNAWLPRNILSVSDGDRQTIEKIAEELEESDDVQEVFTNISSH